MLSDALFVSTPEDTFCVKVLYLFVTIYYYMYYKLLLYRISENMKVKKCKSSVLACCCKPCIFSNLKFAWEYC